MRDKDIERVIRSIVGRGCNRLAEVTYQILGQMFHWQRSANHGESCFRKETG